ncbi:MAG: triose-phosphate isomerase [Thermoplasmata archaeon]|nr:triose-phosphate isomerase [Thermoplasmata archaeon]
MLGDAAERVARELAKLSLSTGVLAAIAPAGPDLGRVARAVDIPVLAQHVDPLELGAHTGYMPPGAVLKAGGRGSLVNHSEHPIPTRAIGQVILGLRHFGLTSVVCAADVPTARRLARFRPDYIAVEPPELIGGTRSVSTARPEVVSGAVTAVQEESPSTRVLCGAGVHNRRDVHRAIELGSSGVLVASAVTKAKDPAGAIAELMAGF